MRRKLITGFTALVVVLLGAGIAWASIPGPDGVIHGCYKTSNPAQGALIVIDSAASCPSGYTALNWNQTTRVERFFTTRTIPAQTTSRVVIVCPTGEAAVSGGFEQLPEGLEVVTLFAQLVENDNDAWMTDIRNSTTQAAIVRFNATCLAGSLSIHF